MALTSGRHVWTLLCVMVLSALAADDVPLNHIQILHAHNSYHLIPEDSVLGLLDSRIVQTIANAILDVTAENGTQSFEYGYPSIYDLLDIWGVRSLELDCFYDPDGGHYSNPAGRKITQSRTPFSTEELDKPGWKVLHIPDVDFNSTCFTLLSCLQQIKDWSDSHDDHIPIFISIEPTEYDPNDLLGTEAVRVLNGFLRRREGEPMELMASLPIDEEAFRSLLDEILSVFNTSDIITPSEIKGNNTSLVQAVTTRGWPLLSELRGRVLFIMSPVYTNFLLSVYPDLENSPIFSSAYNNQRQRDHTVFFAVQVTEPALPTNAARWNRTVDDLTNSLTEYVDQGYIVRGFADYATSEARASYTRRRDRVLAAGTHLVATDFPGGIQPKTFDSTYSVQLENDAVAVCNPQTSDATCQTIDFIKKTEPPPPSPDPAPSPEVTPDEELVELEMEDEESSAHNTQFYLIMLTMTVVSAVVIS